METTETRILGTEELCARCGDPMKVGARVADVGTTDREAFPFATAEWGTVHIGCSTDLPYGLEAHEIRLEPFDSDNVENDAALYEGLQGGAKARVNRSFALLSERFGPGADEAALQTALIWELG